MDSFITIILFYMRKQLLSVSLLLSVLGAHAQKSEVVVGTGLAYGKTFSFSADVKDADSVRVDWGDGKIVTHKTKTSWGTTASVSGKVLSDTVIIYGPLKTLELQKDSVFSLSFKNQQELTR